jgi:hypothetical protein
VPVVWCVLTVFNHGAVVEVFLRRDVIVAAALASVVVWLLALLLLALNYPILRLFEGYGPYHPLRWRVKRYRERFRRASQALAVQATVDAARAKGLDPDVPASHAGDLLRVVRSYPDRAEFILPTRFGNFYRAIEVYSRIVYGLDAIPAWPRLQAVMPEHARKMLADAKAQIDFCVNLSLGGWLVSVLYLGLALAHWRHPSLWLLALAVVVGYGGYWLSASAVQNFGEYVKSAFDLYRGELAKQLGLEVPRCSEAEHEMWRAVSRMMIYRSAARATELSRFRAQRPDAS